MSIQHLSSHLALILALFLPAAASASEDKAENKHRITVSVGFDDGSHHNTEVEMEEDCDAVVHFEEADSRDGLQVEVEVVLPPQETAVEPPPPPRDRRQMRRRARMDRPTYRERANKTRSLGLGLGAGSMVGLHPDDGLPYANHGANIIVRYRVRDWFGLEATGSAHVSLKNEEQRRDGYLGGGVQFHTPSFLPVGGVFGLGYSVLVRSQEGQQQLSPGPYISAGFRVNITPRLTFEAEARAISTLDQDLMPTPMFQSMAGLQLYL